MRRLATYVESAFPYPVTYQSDGAGGLVILPALRVPTKVVQAQQRQQSAMGKSLHGWRGLRSRRRLGDDTGDFGSGIDAGSFNTGDTGDFGSGIDTGLFAASTDPFAGANADGSISLPDGSVIQPDGTTVLPDGTTIAADGSSTGGDVSLANTASATFTDANGNTVFVDSNGNVTNEGIANNPSTAGRSTQGQSPAGGGAGSGGGKSGGGSGSSGLSAQQLAQLLKTLNQKGTAGTPAQLTAQQQAALLNRGVSPGGNLFTQNLGGFPVWEWAVGLLAAGVVVKFVAGGGK